jgi:hypothetical protein
LGCWISPCYSPFSLGGHFETYKLFISLIFQCFVGRGELRITAPADTATADTGACLYLFQNLPPKYKERMLVNF